MQMVMTSDETQIQIFANWPMSNNNISPFPIVKTTRIIHHNQLLLTTFGKNFVMLNQWRQKFYHIEPMTSKWRQKCSPLQVIEPLTEKTWNEVVLFLASRKTKNEMANLQEKGNILNV